MISPSVAPTKRKSSAQGYGLTKAARIGTRGTPSPSFGELSPVSTKDARNEARDTKTPSPRAAPAEIETSIAQHGKLYLYKSALDMVFSQQCKEFQKPVVDLYPKLAATYASLVAKPLDLGTIRANAKLGMYNENPTALMDDVKLVFQNVLDTPVGVFSPGVRKKAIKMLKFSERAFSKAQQKWSPSETVLGSLAVVTRSGTSYVYATCPNFLYVREINAAVTEDWSNVGRAPTHTESLVFHEKSDTLFAVDTYCSTWSLDLSKPGSNWVLINTGDFQLVAMTVVGDTIYAATKTEALVERAVTGAEWKESLTSEGTTIEANAVDGLATHGGLLYAYNDANELWSLDVAGGATEWILSDFPLLPGTAGLCMIGDQVVSANFDCLWQRQSDTPDGWTIRSALPEPVLGMKRAVVKVPSRMLKYDKNKQGNKKPILGIYRSSEYRKPSKGFDLPAPGRAVLDLGAHIGWFTLWCLDNGASKVVSIEATPESHKWHKLNFENDERVTSIHAAAVTQASYEENKTATFRIAPQGNTWRNCLDEYTYWNDATVAEMGSVTVPTVSVEKLLSEHPDIHMVKIDIEGAEMGLLETVVWPQHVEYLVFEYSIGTRCCNLACPGSVAKGCGTDCSKVRFPATRERLEAQGFHVQFAPSYWNVCKGKKNAVYDEIIFCKRVKAPVCPPCKSA